MKRHNKPGMGKYAHHRGPGPREPLAKQLAYWQQDAANETKELERARDAGDKRLIRLAHRYLRQANQHLAQIASEVL